MINFIDSCKVAYTKLPEDLFLSIKDEILNQIEKDINTEKIPNDTLHGYLIIENTVPLNFSKIEKFVLNLIDEHEKKFAYLETSINGKVELKIKPPKLRCEKIWFNTQKSGGYFPLHYHSGIYSFIIWINMPYLIKEENFLKTSEKVRDGMFEFLFSDSFGKIENYLLPVDKTWEGTIAVFPSELHHQVYPFYTENPKDLRISISGDVYIGKENF